MVPGTRRTTYQVETFKLTYGFLDDLLHFWFQRDDRWHAKTAPTFALNLFIELVQFGSTW